MTRYRNIQTQTSGFTLVELMLAMLFISALLLAIGGLVIQVGAVFTKGMTVRSVNEAGQLIASDMQRTFNSASGASFVDKSGSGRICIGGYVYAWNIKGSESTKNTYLDGTDEPINFVKFQGGAAQYCSADGSEQAKVPAGATDLLSSQTSNLLVQSLVVKSSTVVDDPTQNIYSISLRIGTGDAVVRPGGCEVPDNAIDDQYCSINSFNFTARTGNAL